MFFNEILTKNRKKCCQGVKIQLNWSPGAHISWRALAWGCYKSCVADFYNFDLKIVFFNFFTESARKFSIFALFSLFGVIRVNSNLGVEQKKLEMMKNYFLKKSKKHKRSGNLSKYELLTPPELGERSR